MNNRHFVSFCCVVGVCGSLTCGFALRHSFACVLSLVFYFCFFFFVFLLFSQSELTLDLRTRTLEWVGFVSEFCPPPADEDAQLAAVQSAFKYFWKGVAEVGFVSVCAIPCCPLSRRCVGVLAVVVVLTVCGKLECVGRRCD